MLVREGRTATAVLHILSRNNVETSAKQKSSEKHKQFDREKVEMLKYNI